MHITMQSTPAPSGAQVVPFQRAIRLATVPPIVVKSPATTSSGPFPASNTVEAVIPEPGSPLPRGGSAVHGDPGASLAAWCATMPSTRLKVPPTCRLAEAPDPETATVQQFTGEPSSFWKLAAVGAHEVPFHFATWPTIAG